MDLQSLAKGDREQLKKSFDEEKATPKSLQLSEETRNCLEAAINDIAAKS